jgi:hypothetical protein
MLTLKLPPSPNTSDFIAQQLQISATMQAEHEQRGRQQQRRKAQRPGAATRIPEVSTVPEVPRNLRRMLYVRPFVVPLAVVDTLHMIRTIIVVALLSLLSGLLYLLLATSCHNLIITFLFLLFTACMYECIGQLMAIAG